MYKYGRITLMHGDESMAQYLDRTYPFKALAEGVPFTDTRTDDERKRAERIEQAHS